MKTKIKKFQTYFILFFVILSSCAFSQTQIKSFNNAQEKQAISSIDKKAVDEIVGLWKLYKTIYADGSSAICHENYFFNLINDKTNGRKFEKSGQKGDWFVSFSDSDSTDVVTFLTTIKPSTSDKADVNFYLISKLIENGTTYFVLLNMITSKTEIYLRQM